MNYGYTTHDLYLLPSHKKRAYQGQIMRGTGNYLYNLSRDVEDAKPSIPYDLFVVDECIPTKDDWVVDIRNGNVAQVSSFHDTYGYFTDDRVAFMFLQSYHKRIIATSCPDVKVPQFSQNFLKEFINRSHKQENLSRIILLKDPDNKMSVIEGFVIASFCTRVWTFEQLEPLLTKFREADRSNESMSISQWMINNLLLASYETEDSEEQD